jgi:hypothetical protein
MSSLSLAERPGPARLEPWPSRKILQRMSTSLDSAAVIFIRIIWKLLTMLCNIQNCGVSGLGPSSGIQNTEKKTTFRKLDLFSSSGEGCSVIEISAF